MNNRDAYRRLCETGATIPIFSRAWWLDAVCGEDNWDVVTVVHDGEIAGSLPYVMKARYGLRTITMPVLTQTLGPWIRYPSSQKYPRRLAHEKSVMTDLIAGLPAHDYFIQDFHYSIANWLPFYWAGFSASANYTYVIEDLNDTQRLWDNLEKRTRTSIRKALNSGIQVKECDDIELLLDLNELTYRRQRRELPYSRDFVRRIDAACKERNARRIFVAYGADGVPESALFCVFDADSTYYLIQGADPTRRDSGANALAVWTSIQAAANDSWCYDFEGSMVESIEQFIRSFGGVQKPYFRLTRLSPRAAVLMALRDLVRARRR